VLLDFLETLLFLETQPHLDFLGILQLPLDLEIQQLQYFHLNLLDLDFLGILQHQLLHSVDLVDLESQLNLEILRLQYSQ
jgi:hypothetical protein